MRNRLLIYVAAFGVALLVLAACEADDTDDVAEEEPEDAEVVDEPEEEEEEPEEEAEPEEEEEAEPDDDGEEAEGTPVYTDPSIPDLDIVFERDRFTILVHTLPAEDRMWSDTFDNVNVVYSDDPVAPLAGGAAWIVQAEPGIVWPALEEGVMDGVIVGVTNDTEAWYMMAREGIDGPDDLPGQRITGGTIGDTWITVGEIILRDEFGIDPDEMEWVSVSGGSDGRMEAMLAGEVDVFMGQPRNLPPTEESGGSAVFSERVDNAQTQFIVERETWENNQDAVCAALEGHLETVLWLFDYEEDEGVDKVPEVNEHFEAHGYDTEDNEELWVSSYPFTLSRDMGAGADAFDRQEEVLKGADDPLISDDFDWREYVDFTCLWELQEAYGLPLRPDPDDL